MGIIPTTVSNTTSTPIDLTDAKGAPAKIWNPVDNTDNVAIHLNGAAGATPVAETHSTADLTVVTDTTAGEVAIPDGTRFVDDAGEFWDVDTGEGVTNPAATAGTGEVTVAGDTSGGAIHIPAGSRVTKAGEGTTGPFWELDDDVDLTPATYSTVVATFTIDNDGNEVTIPEGQKVKKAAVATTWSADDATVVPSATPSTATVTLTGAQGTTYPVGTDVKKAAVATIWNTDEEAIISNGVTATAGTCLNVELVGTPSTVIAAGKRISKTGEDGTGPYWELDAQVTIGGTGIGHGDFTCLTTGAIAAAAGELDTIVDAVAGWDGVENDTAATAGLDAADGTVDVGVTCSVNGATAATAGTLDTVVGPPVGHTSVTNAAAATLGLPIVATIAVDCTCDTIGDEAATAGTIDTIVTAPAHVSAVTNAVDAIVGTTETPTATVGVTCLTKDAISANAGTLTNIKDTVAGWTSVTNAAPVTPGTEKDYSNTIGVVAHTGGAVAAGAGEITALETDITGVVSITNAAPAVEGDDFVEGSDGDFVIPPGAGHPIDPNISSLGAKALGSAPVLVQLLTGADALQDDIATLEGIEVDVDLDASAANTERTTATKVLPVQHVDQTGAVPPAGDAADNAPFAALALAGTAISASAPLPAYNPKLGATYVASAKVSVTNSNAERVASNANRKGMILKSAIGNSDFIWLAWGATAAAADYGLPLEPGETREFWGERCPTAALNGISSSGNQTLYVEEIT